MIGTPARKKCLKCKTTKPIGCFDRTTRKGSLDGFTTHCSECRQAAYEATKSRPATQFRLKTCPCCRNERLVSIFPFPQFKPPKDVAPIMDRKTFCHDCYTYAGLQQKEADLAGATMDLEPEDIPKHLRYTRPPDFSSPKGRAKLDEAIEAERRHRASQVAPGIARHELSNSLAPRPLSPFEQEQLAKAKA